MQDDTKDKSEISYSLQNSNCLHSSFESHLKHGWCFFPITEIRGLSSLQFFPSSFQLLKEILTSPSLLFRMCKDLIERNKTKMQLLAVFSKVQSDLYSFKIYNFNQVSQTSCTKGCLKSACCAKVFRKVSEGFLRETRWIVSLEHCSPSHTPSEKPITCS